MEIHPRLGQDANAVSAGQKLFRQGKAEADDEGAAARRSYLQMSNCNMTVQSTVLIRGTNTLGFSSVLLEVS